MTGNGCITYVLFSNVYLSSRVLVVVCSPVRRATSYTAAPSITIPSHPHLAPSSACFRISWTQLFRPRKVPEFRLRLVGLVTTCLSTGCRPTLTSPPAGQASLLIPAHILAPPMTGQDSKVQGAITCIICHGDEDAWGRFDVGFFHPGLAWVGIPTEAALLQWNPLQWPYIALISTLSAPPICPVRNHIENPIKN